MSHTEYKVGLVGEIMGLRGKSEDEIYKYFYNNGIVPDEYSEKDGVYYDLEYCTYKGCFVPVVVDGGVLITYVFNSGPLECECDSDTMISSAELMYLITAMHKGFDECNPKFFSYLWYNGTDEPIYIDDKYRGE